MKQIKTIKNRLDNAEAFDAAVNTALAEGWQLKKREVINPMAQGSGHFVYIMLYAELEREDITEAERCCENCAHSYKRVDEKPCRDCSENADKWEPADA